MANEVWLGTATGWATAGDWVSGNVPTDAGTATFDFNATGAVAGSDQSATELAALYIPSTYLYAFGTNGTPLSVDATLVEIGRASGSSTPGAHSGRINLKTPDLASTIMIFGTCSTSTDTGKEPVRIQSANASGNKLIFSGTGRVGIATDTLADFARFDEVACLGTGTINISALTTLVKWRQEGGTGNIFCAGTTLQQDAGVVYTYGSGAWTTLNISGTAYPQSSGTITTLNVFADGTVDMLGDSRAKTITTVNLYKGATFKYDPNVITITNPINLIACELEDVTIVTPKGLTVAIVKT